VASPGLADSALKLDPTVLGDPVGKRGNGGFGRFGAKGGIDRFAGKSEIAEGRSDLRESVIRNDLLVGGHQRTDRSELLVALCALLGSATG